MAVRAALPAPVRTLAELALTVGAAAHGPNQLRAQLAELEAELAAEQAKSLAAQRTMWRIEIGQRYPSIPRGLLARAMGDSPEEVLDDVIRIGEEIRGEQASPQPNGNAPIGEEVTGLGPYTRELLGG